MEKVFLLSEIHTAAKELWDEFQAYKLWAFEGGMGSGKTTFIHALCDVLGVQDAVSSPTFSIINQYQTGNGAMLYHLDLYRIKDEDEALQAGVEEVLYSGDYCMIEWPVKIKTLLPPDTLRLHIEPVDSLQRRITLLIPD